ncbi:aminopeptidase [Thermogemmatispora onikobensis]|uniref:aminopeptidase n=1 Tax=Thermogemmatispora onikobensis TaxID=732234 RepID=UPI000852B428|nr:aminopeptidase [Thermogemmatispora onikobensis]
MHDIRLARWARTLVDYCLQVQPGQLVAIQSTPLAVPLIENIYRELLRAGAYPLTLLSLDRLEELLLREGNDDQLQNTPSLHEGFAERIAARLGIEAASNTSALTTLDPGRLAMRRKAQGALRNRLQQREQEGSYRWCLTLYPTEAYAQDAGLSLSEFEEFVFEACFLNDPDPAARWRDLSQQQQRLVAWLEGKQRIRVLSEGTDLTLSIVGRRFINSDGRRNFPSGEIFTSPVEESLEGTITFDLPSAVDGRLVEGIRLAFAGGKVVEASARQGQDYLLRMLDIDNGARIAGEFAFGNNWNIQRSTRNILFDEKIGGTIHLALGASYPEAGGQNRSALHWDLICDLRKGGEVWVDDTLFLKDGRILI